MAIKGQTALTLADWAKRVDPNGKVDKIVELLSQTNEILDDMLFVEGNLPTGHRTTVRTGLPQATWRLLNYGVKQGKSTTAQVTDAIGMLETYSEIDKSLADLNGNTSEFRLSEDQAFLEGMNQTMAETVFYGDATINPQRFTGLSARYNDLSAKNAQNIIDAGGTGSNLTSIWLVVWGANTIHGIFPKGQKAGIQHEDKGQQTLTDDDGGKYEGYRTHYKWDCGISVRDWRYAVRICNIDTTTLDSDENAANLLKLIVKAFHRIPNLKLGKAALYGNRTVMEYIDVQALEKASLAVKTQETEGIFWQSIRGVPLRTCDSLLDTESQVV
ncbi:major capsid protein [Serratia nevei]|uniref:major capsid protein n=1 Tax=Serratia nevei TaxID=2703794 RepID=UPI00313CB03B